MELKRLILDRDEKFYILKAYADNNSIPKYNTFFLDSEKAIEFARETAKSNKVKLEILD